MEDSAAIYIDDIFWFGILCTRYVIFVLQTFVFCYSMRQRECMLHLSPFQRTGCMRFFALKYLTELINYTN